MLQVGRNDLCPCGSGRKHKRCCLDARSAALRHAGQLEDRIGELGYEARRDAFPAWRAEFERSIGPLGRLGTAAVQEVAWFETWLVCDAPVIGGRTPLEATPAPRAVDERLRASEICGWWARGDDFPLAATQWRYEEPLMLHSGHEPLGELDDGALVVARGVAMGGGHVALVGRPIVVDELVVEDVLALLARAPDQALCAALRWPEERTVTAAGEIVAQRSRYYELDDAEYAITLLRAAAGFTEVDDLGTLWEDDVVFRAAAPAISATSAPPEEPGVIWELCEEDAADPPILGEITVSPDDGDISLSAPSERHVEALLGALPERLVAVLGALVSEDVDVPDVLSRVRRERLASML